MRPTKEEVMAFLKPEPATAEEMAGVAGLQPGDYEICSERLNMILAECKEVFSQIYKEYGQLDILINDAGVGGPRGAPHKISEEELDRVMAVNMNGPFFCTKYVVPYLSRSGGGSIVNVASDYGIIGGDTPVYDASKGALRSMTKSDAIVLSKHGIRVNSVHPGNIWTPLFEKMEKELGGIPEDTSKIISASVPAARMGRPEEVAYGILFLASDEASYVTSAEHG
jgi:NAD(P)-dependent dehydrogenase (short-subunit alcohol dehydrogenase family)